jgi:hypothetical protein
MYFLKSFGAWAICTCLLPLELIVISHPAKLSSLLESVLFFVPFLLIPAIVSLVLCMPTFRRGTLGRNLFAGVSLGLLLPILGGVVWMRLYPGFESQPAIFIGSLLTAGPSAAGGGFAGWLRYQSKPVEAIR